MRTTLVFVVALAGPVIPARAVTLKPESGLQIAESATLLPGTYVLSSPIEIVADAVTVEGGGVFLVGADLTGSAIVATSRTNLTIRNVTIERFGTGIRLDRCRDISIEGCSIQHTAEIGPLKTWLDIWVPAERAYGAGILLAEVTGGRVVGNDLSHQQNGLSMYGCSKLLVQDNHASYCSGWGIHLNSSSDNVIERNVADFCNRVYTYESGAQYLGADSAGLLMVVNSRRNVVRGNSFRAGGDGVFVAGLSADGVKCPCNDNLFERNDCSLSPNNAFEATFCSGNVFRHNKANGSNYGFWLGYSRDTEVIGNEVAANRYAGVAIEHGQRNRIVANKIARNHRGVYLWTDPDEDFAAAFPDQRSSQDNVVADNEITENEVGILIETDEKMGGVYCSGGRLTGNRIRDNATGMRLTRTTGIVVRDNELRDNKVCGLEIIGGEGDSIFNNILDNPMNALCDGPHTWSTTPTEGKTIIGTHRLGGNFWSDYAGRDTDGDGLGDTAVPHTASRGIEFGGDARPLLPSVAGATTRAAQRSP